ncbi:Isochorismatase-like protein [Lasiosphaeria miniovina]|uniref:Isochorismatase-like protein n=1 Tax=Lasiosphaeria miniovina TaxID=1954250 RepID=A0AA40AB62_9PEZI|nr:Isochorismatase-like protein [Lasiosphaeria miniovina]KAK0712649.1 Isochorismatase-like protein [Lasiosphaeria miniovina]
MVSTNSDSAPPATASTGTAAGVDGATANRISAFRLRSSDQSAAVLGSESKGNFWLWDAQSVFDLTHPPTRTSEPVQPRLTLQCALTPVAIDPAKTALVIIDMQNYNMSSALGNHVQAYRDDEANILAHALPAAQQIDPSHRPDVRFHKNRNSGLCDKSSPVLAQFLARQGIRTLLFAGLCVMGTLQDASLKGFDCILLKDGCGTNRPSSPS